MLFVSRHSLETMLPCCHAAMLPCCHAATCKQGGDVVARHNHYCCHAHQVVISLDHSHGCLADILALDWDRGKHAAFDITVTSPLSATIHPEAARSVCGGGEMLPLSEGFIRPGRMGYGTVLLRDIVPVEWQLCVKGYNNGTPGLMVDKKFHTFL